MSSIVRTIIRNAKKKVWKPCSRSRMNRCWQSHSMVIADTEENKGIFPLRYFQNGKWESGVKVPECKDTEEWSLAKRETFVERACKIYAVLPRKTPEDLEKFAKVVYKAILLWVPVYAKADRDGVNPSIDLARPLTASYSEQESVSFLESIYVDSPLDGKVTFENDNEVLSKVA